MLSETLCFRLSSDKRIVEAVHADFQISPACGKLTGPEGLLHRVKDLHLVEAILHHIIPARNNPIFMPRVVVLRRVIPPQSVNVSLPRMGGRNLRNQTATSCKTAT